MSTCQPGPRCQPDVNFVGSVSLSACFGCVGSRAAVCVDMGLDVSPMSTWAVMSAHVSFVDVVSLSVGCMSTLGFNRVNNWRRNRNCVRLYVGRCIVDSSAWATMSARCQPYVLWPPSSPVGRGACEAPPTAWPVAYLLACSECVYKPRHGSEVSL